MVTTTQEAGGAVQQTQAQARFQAAQRAYNEARAQRSDQVISLAPPEVIGGLGVGVSYTTGGRTYIRTSEEGGIVGPMGTTFNPKTNTISYPILSSPLVRREETTSGARVEVFPTEPFAFTPKQAQQIAEKGSVPVQTGVNADNTVYGFVKVTPEMVRANAERANAPSIVYNQGAFNVRPTPYFAWERINPETYRSIEYGKLAARNEMTERYGAGAYAAAEFSGGLEKFANQLLPPVPTGTPALAVMEGQRKVFVDFGLGLAEGIPALTVAALGQVEYLKAASAKGVFSKEYLAAGARVGRYFGEGAVHFIEDIVLLKPRAWGSLVAFELFGAAWEGLPREETKGLSLSRMKIDLLEVKSGELGTFGIGRVRGAELSERQRAELLFDKSQVFVFLPEKPFEIRIGETTKVLQKGEAYIEFKTGAVVTDIIRPTGLSALLRQSAPSGTSIFVEGTNSFFVGRGFVNAEGRPLYTLLREENIFKGNYPIELGRQILPPKLREEFGELETSQVIGKTGGESSFARGWGMSEFKMPVRLSKDLGSVAILEEKPRLLYKGKFLGLLQTKIGSLLISRKLFGKTIVEVKFGAEGKGAKPLDFATTDFVNVVNRGGGLIKLKNMVSLKAGSPEVSKVAETLSKAPISLFTETGSGGGMVSFMRGAAALKGKTGSVDISKAAQNYFERASLNEGKTANKTANANASKVGYANLINSVSSRIAASDILTKTAIDNLTKTGSASASKTGSGSAEKVAQVSLSRAVVKIAAIGPEDIPLRERIKGGLSSPSFVSLNRRIRRLQLRIPKIRGLKLKREPLADWLSKTKTEVVTRKPASSPSISISEKYFKKTLGLRIPTAEMLRKRLKF